MRIREYKPEDKEQVITLVTNNLSRVFNGDPTKFTYIKEFSNQKNYIKYLVAETMDKKRRIIATMGLKHINKEKVRLKRMYVAREYQKRGIAQKMLNKLIIFAKEQGYKHLILSTYPVMRNAKRFYKKNQFKEFEAKPEEQVHVVKEL